MYIDVELTEDKKSRYEVSIYRNGKVENITSSNMSTIAEYIQQITKINEMIYINNGVLELYLTDCFEQIGVKYTIL